jgi:hypothetical protein
MLNNILTDIASDIGGDLTVASQKALIIDRVNKAAKEIYTKTDLKNSLREQVFDLDTETAQVTLPHYVGEVRGMRHYDARLRISINTYAPRYHYGMAHEVWALKFRKLSKSPIQREISNESTLEFSIPLVESVNISLVITGRTSNSNRFSETVVIPAGELTAMSVGNYTSVESLQKTAYTIYDVTVKDVDDNTLAVISNNELASEYNLFQVLDYNIETNTAVIECLYKHKFYPFRSDNDEFVCGPDYDRAIYYKYVEYELARQQKFDQAILAQSECNRLIKEIGEDAEIGIELETNFAPSPYYQATEFAVGMFGRRTYPHFAR